MASSTRVPVATCPLPKNNELWDVGDWVQWCEDGGLPAPPARLAEIPVWAAPDVRRQLDRRQAIRAGDIARRPPAPFPRPRAR